MRSMRQAQGPAHWTGNPTLSQHWLGSALCALAMLVFHVVCFLKMPFSRNARECHAEPAPRGLPDGTRDTSIKETVPAAAAIDSRSRHHHARHTVRACARRGRAEQRSRSRREPCSLQRPHPLHESCSGLTRASLGDEVIVCEQRMRPKNSRLTSKRPAGTIWSGGPNRAQKATAVAHSLPEDDPPRDLSADASRRSAKREGGSLGAGRCLKSKR